MAYVTLAGRSRIKARNTKDYHEHRRARISCDAEANERGRGRTSNSQT